MTAVDGVDFHPQWIFEPFPKIARLNREIIITEKIDGTNAQVHVLEDGHVLAASRTRYITPENDNYGFARWVKEHEDELRHLGPGRHFGEWWGAGIQRRYGLAEKRFSLFNVGKWFDRHSGYELGDDKRCYAPDCCYVVPILYRGDFTDIAIEQVLSDLGTDGSAAAPGFMDPEGIVVYHTAAKTLFKVTLKNDEQPKGKTE